MEKLGLKGDRVIPHRIMIAGFGTDELQSLGYLFAEIRVGPFQRAIQDARDRCSSPISCSAGATMDPQPQGGSFDLLSMY